MKVIVNGQIFDSKKTPVVLSWENEKEREFFAHDIFFMSSVSNIHAEFPEGTTNKEFIINGALTALGINH